MATTKSTAVSETTEKKAESSYTREQVAASRRYANRRDLVIALLEDGKTYTLAEVDEMIEKFMKGAVK